jgi:uncharacterized protein (DUF2336 family)
MPQPQMPQAVVRALSQLRESISAIRVFSEREPGNAMLRSAAERLEQDHRELLAALQTLPDFAPRPGGAVKMGG